MKSLPSPSLATVEGCTLEYVRAGTGSPTIVLINGSGGPLDAWMRVFAELEALGTVFAYNRPGIGKSSKPTVPQTGEVMMESLRALLLAVELPPPYILVAHSLGGLIANLHARGYPSEVSGLVLLDATAPEDIAAMAAFESPLQRFLTKTLDRILGKEELGETAHVGRTVELIEEAPPFPDCPLVVVTGGRPAMAWLTPKEALEARAEHQRRLASLSPRGKHVIAEKSGHFPQLTEPAVVVQAVREAIQSMEVNERRIL